MWEMYKPQYKTINKSRAPLYLAILVSLSALTWIASAINGYVVNYNHDKFGLPFNTERKRLSIPIIPSYWHVKRRDNIAIEWIGKEDVIGHKRKTIAFTGSDIDGELDTYKLPDQAGKQRWIEIEYRYKNKEHSDSISYTYQIEHHADEISRIKADSIFAGEKINKDY